VEVRALDDAFAEKAQSLIDNIAHTVVAPAETIRLCVICLMAEGHLLLDDLPGVG
jgi:MoxR-like ATPase